MKSPAGKQYYARRPTRSIVWWPALGGLVLGSVSIWLYVRDVRLRESSLPPDPPASRRDGQIPGSKFTPVDDAADGDRTLRPRVEAHSGLSGTREPYGYAFPESAEAIRAELLRVLGVIGGFPEGFEEALARQSESVGPVLVAIVGDPSASRVVRGGAARLLSTINPPGALEALRSAVLENGGARDEAIEAIARRRDPGRGEFLGGVLVSGDIGTIDRYMLIDGIMYAGDQAAIPFLQSFCNSIPATEDALVGADLLENAQRAVRLLGVLDNDNPEPGLVSLLYDNDPIARSWALFQLHDREQSPSLVAHLRASFDVLKKRPALERRRYLGYEFDLLSMIQRLGGPVSTEESQFIKEFDPEVRPQPLK